MPEAIITSKESGNGAKPGEATPQRAAPTASGDKTNLAPEKVISLLSSEFAAPAPAAAAAKKPEEEVPSGAKAEPIVKGGEGATAKDKQPEWSAEQKSYFELRAQATTPEEIAAADAKAPEFSDEERAWIEAHPEGGEAAAGEDGNGSGSQTLPEHLEAELEQWEKKGGQLPASLQKMVDKRIHKLVDERDDHKQRADTAEAEVTRLNGELEQAASARPAPTGVLNEKSLSAMVDASKKFQADARAYIGDYASDEQIKRVEKHMEVSGLDKKGLQRSLDEVNDWLTQSAPQLQQQVATFKTTEAKIAPLVAERFASMDVKTNPEYGFARDVLKFIPDLPSRTPAHRFAMGLYALGKMAYDHLDKANPKGDVIQALRGVLTKHVPLTAAGDKKKFFLPGKKPPGTPGGAPGGSPRVARKDAQSEQASEKLKTGGTAADMESALKNSLATV